MTEPERAGRFALQLATLLVRLRWVVIGFWVSACLLVTLVFPSLGEVGGGSGIQGLLPRDTPAVATELRSVRLFGFPLLGRTVIVQRNPERLSVFAQARTVVNAVAVNRQKYADLGPLLGALPITNAFGVFPGARERDTTALTYLFFDPSVSFARQTRAAQHYADRFFQPRDHLVGVTGSVPARDRQGTIISDNLPKVELLTLTAIAIIVGLAFRSVVAPVVALLTTGVAAVLTLRLSGLISQLLGAASPSELEPVVVALLLGVVTDYVVFFCSSLRHELAGGTERLAAAHTATARFLPIIGVAGLAVAAGTGALLVAKSAFFAALGPALVFTVLVALLVAVTLVPALMAVLGRLVFWPSRPAALEPEAATGTGRTSRRSVFSWVARGRPRAAAAVAVGVVGLLAAAVPATHLALGVSFVGSLPGNDQVREAAAAAEKGFAPGILSPTTVLVQQPGITSQRRQLDKLSALLRTEPGVAGVLGPGDAPNRLVSGTLLSNDGSAARYLVVFDQPALGAGAIASVDQLQSRLPTLLHASGLDRATAALAGDTAAAAFIVDQAKRDLLRIAVAALLANFLMLVLFLRAVVAATYLLVASMLSLAASLGLTTVLFDYLDPGAGLTFYVPFSAAVLLLAFGSDYNIFAVGNIWEEARRRPLPEAIAVVMPRTIGAIFAAGVALAASFGLLSVVPLVPFRQLAFVMFVGIMLDVLVVRAVLVPALLTVVGRFSAWPSSRLSSAAAAGPPSGGRRPAAD